MELTQSDVADAALWKSMRVASAAGKTPCNRDVSPESERQITERKKRRPMSHNAVMLRERERSKRERRRVKQKVEVVRILRRGPEEGRRE